MNSKAIKQPEYIFLYGKTISLEMILRSEKHFYWTKRNLNWRTTSPLSENELEKGTILFAHFYELLNLHEIYCLSFQALIKLPSTIAIATHNHRMIFSDFSQFLHTHTHKKSLFSFFIPCGSSSIIWRGIIFIFIFTLITSAYFIHHLTTIIIITQYHNVMG